MTFPYHQNVLKDTISGIAITALISSIAITFPIIGFFCLMLLPQPVIFYRLKLGRKPGLAIIGAPILFIMLASGEIFADTAFLLGMMGLGFFMGEFIERRLSVEKTIGYACGAVIIAGFSILLIYANLLNAGITGWLSDYISKNLEMTVLLYQKMGMPEETIRILEDSMEHITFILVRMLPSMIAGGLLFVGWLNLLTARGLFQRWQMAYADFGALNQWKAPEILVWGVIAGIVMLLVPNNGIKFIGLNGLVVLMVIYFFQGIAVTSYYLEQKRFPLVLRWLIYGFIAIQQILLLIVIGLGFLDVWANFRRLDVTPPADSNPDPDD